MLADSPNRILHVEGDSIVIAVNRARLNTHPTLWGKTDAERWAALDDAALKLNQDFQKDAVITGTQLALRQLDGVHRNPKA